MASEAKTVLEKHPDYTANIGFEIHVQLKTESKIFCSCPNKFGQQPNKNICPVCSGNPGTLPILNKKVVDFAIMAGLATNCAITRKNEFSRKHYTYPDLPKNFQITQGEVAICQEGFIEITLEDGSSKKIRINRIHMEEDAGKNIHGEHGESFVDLNRAGTPLLEIVSYPDISSAFEAKAYLSEIKKIVQYLDVSDANMEEGSFRADTNISVRKKSQEKLGTKVELKNINSFRFISQAIDYEIERQVTALEEGEQIYQETRLWDNKKQVSAAMRSKEEANDYRYFTEPDIPPIMIDEEWIKQIKKTLPELPQEKFNRFQKEYDLSSYEAEILIDPLELANFFEETVKISNHPKQVCNWMLRDLLAYLKNNNLSLTQAKITPTLMAEFVSTVEKGIINSKIAQDVFAEMLESGKSPLTIIKEKGLEQISSPEELERIVLEVIAQNKDNVDKYRAGNDKLFAFFVGQSMKATKGKGNPQLINELLKKHL
ncbi:TPA: Asp-tRNA(Asn)/Glu-tRNA(Gln) amidotransferase GatCAB subunit B [Candidatus Dependentiae bacterium]|nr:MAG: Aspartyl/glutamyl-tRNA(Asn/Gln) amidotransferase subunit B [candidate division TM6 bacterium GW2011_GWE2_31_21]KKP53837.1 MAG: Aspartyl/glutamyl-tRNA(Asn/Gln) amidotransferase subunit B [candidate division TM6 bacterium GW2011_GWF2_33_332]HBS47617.1 Asp-tRNA(Asn)/Glu-tRNA(Gln) amidotransferase GatCAB subunit B [Candidatus Dependentiae bacterium]HBZ73766.1 Asp-tRNA(Asn)/Glu-tRNA(Gln) amidotransferase GatCAB subunit B [Candidatus Dependentiae bacterium]